MSLIINPGSKISKGTFKQALLNTEIWQKNIIEEFPEVTMSTNEDYDGEGRWTFKFTHSITGKVATLDIHGFTDKECDEFMFQPKVYWNGSSCSNPEPNNWLTDKYTWKYTYVLKEK